MKKERDKPTEQWESEALNQVKEKSFAEQVDEVLAGTANRYNDLKVCDTPDILQKIGCAQLPVFYTQKHLRDALRPKGSKGESIHHHGLKVEQIKSIPELLRNPVLIYDSLSRDDSIVIVTSETDQDNKPVVAVIRPDGKAKYEMELVDSNFMTSVHGRDNFDNQIKKALEQNKILYCDKQKSQELFSVLGLQLSQGFNNFGFNKIIHQSNNVVNSKKSDVKNENEQTVMSEIEDKVSHAGTKERGMHMEDREDLNKTSIDQYIESKINQSIRGINDLKDYFVQETGEDISDWKIGMETDKEIRDKFISGNTQQLEFAINELGEAGLTYGLDSKRHSVLDDVRELRDYIELQIREKNEMKEGDIHSKQARFHEVLVPAMESAGYEYIVDLDNDRFIFEKNGERLSFETISDLDNWLEGMPKDAEIKPQDGKFLYQKINDPNQKTNILADYHVSDLSQIETGGMTAMEKELLAFDIVYTKAGGSMELRDANDCLMTYNTQKLRDSINREFSDDARKQELRSAAHESTERIENMARTGGLSEDEMRNIIVTALEKDKFTESMDNRLLSVLDVYGHQDVADGIWVKTTLGTSPLSGIEYDPDLNSFTAEASFSFCDINVAFKGEDVVSVMRSEDDFFAVENDTTRSPIWNTVGEMNKENTLYIQLLNDKQSFDMAIWHNEDGVGQFAVTDIGQMHCGNNVHDNDVNVLVMGECPKNYEDLHRLVVNLAQDSIGDFDSGKYKLQYISDKLEDIVPPVADVEKLPVQATFIYNDTKHTVYFQDEKTAETFSESYLEHSGWAVDVDISVRPMDDKQVESMLESVDGVHAYGVPGEYTYITFEIDKENQSIVVTGYDHELTPYAQETVTFPGKAEFVAEVKDFSALSFVHNHLTNNSFPTKIDSLSWISADEFLADVAEHKEHVKRVADKFDSIESNARFEVAYISDDGKSNVKEYVDTIDDLRMDEVLDTGTFEVRESGNLIVKGNIDDNMRDIITEAIAEDNVGIRTDKEREALGLDHPASEQEIAHAISKILYAHSDQDLSLDEIEADIMQQIEEAQGQGDTEKLDNIISRLDKVYQNDCPTLEESAGIYICEERLTAIKDETQTKQTEQKAESRKADMPAKAGNSFTVAAQIEQSRQDDLVTKQQNPLNKVEELLEGNYNQIDGVINNLPKEEKEDRKPSPREVIEPKKKAVHEHSQSNTEEKEQPAERSKKKYSQVDL